jgi:hypothetical protein
MSKELAVNPVVLREEVKSKYRDVAINPSGEYHFHTGRPLARRLGYDSALAARGRSPIFTRCRDQCETVTWDRK